MSERRRRGEIQIRREGVRKQAFRRERLRDQLDDMPRSPGSSDSDQDEHRYQARLLNSKDVAAYRAGQRDASLESEAGQRTPRSSSKRKTDSPHNSQAKVASGKSPSVQLQDTPSVAQNKRSTIVGMADRLASLQTDGEEVTAEPAPLTWHKNPFERPGANSVSILSAGMCIHA